MRRFFIRVAAIRHFQKELIELPQFSGYAHGHGFADIDATIEKLATDLKRGEIAEDEAVAQLEEIATRLAADVKEVSPAAFERLLRGDLG